MVSTGPTIPSEVGILARDYGCRVDQVPEGHVTGVDFEDLTRVTCAALSTIESPTVSFYRRGTFNRLYRLHFALTGRDVLARIPSPASRNLVSVTSTVATMLYAQHICIPVPHVIAWNDASTGTSGQVPYIITDLVQEAYDAWSSWRNEPSERKERIFETFARTQAAFLRPIELPLSSIGTVSGAAPTPAHFSLQPLTIRHKYALAPRRRPRTPLIRVHSLLLRDVWLELLDLHRSSCLEHTVSTSPDYEQVLLNWNIENLDPDDAILAPVTDFLAVVDDLRALVERTLDALNRRPAFLQPCLVRTDFAFRNVLLDPDTLETKACIDFDDVQVMPLVLAHIFPQDLLEFEEPYVSRDAPYFAQEGGFSQFPPDEYGPEDLCPEKTTDDEGAYERLASNKRIKYTAYRTSYLAALERADPRIAEEGWWELHKDARKVHELLVGGTHMWWLKREWLRMRRAVSDSVPASSM
ncbi:hypothetical protein EXIGLDRAFT_720711 [Exidia glandulosa HHB12029]|uniref:Uncharacterized protein n=1 Tax=Exidia glandulosa HHB12029 TaxID=1314781 RepID=A0A165G6G0_EXIGL|nr:hypothetical protein EXIGLDRAFT_720711 [Exidia glandulosa HHB12029]